MNYLFTLIFLYKLTNKAEKSADLKKIYLRKTILYVTIKYISNNNYYAALIELNISFK